VFLNTDMMVSCGVNVGEPVTNASDSVVGDVYVFSASAQAREMVVRDTGAGHRNRADLFEDDTRGQTIGEGSQIGVLGQGLELESRLTFMGSDGSTVEVLIINNTCIGGGASGEYFLPLSPLAPGMDYTLIKADVNPGRVSYADLGCVCFTRGTRITMADGSQRRIEDLVPGDMVLTRDSGARPLRWVGHNTVRAHGPLSPVVITRGTLGNDADLVVSQQHRMLITDWRAEVMLGASEVLVRAKDLVNGETVYLRPGGFVDYFHILFDDHEIVYAEGAPSESLHINARTLSTLPVEARDELFGIFPELATRPHVSAVATRMSLKSYEASALLRQVALR
jgi:hypothetical protein